MNDLIDREAAIEAMYDFMVCGSFAFLQCGAELEEKIKSVPSIPAVPLDKLCEWLANSFSDPPCCVLENVRCKMECQGFTQMNYSECWRYILTKWVEGLDATDRC